MMQHCMQRVLSVIPRRCIVQAYARARGLILAGASNFDVHRQQGVACPHLAPRILKQLLQTGATSGQWRRGVDCPCPVRHLGEGASRGEGAPA